MIMMILTLISLILFGINIFLWVSLVRSGELVMAASDSIVSERPIKEKVNRVKKQEKPKSKSKKTKTKSRKKENVTDNELGLELDMDMDDGNINDFGIKERDRSNEFDGIENTEFGALDQEFGFGMDEPIKSKKPKKNKEMDLEEEFSEIFSQDETEYFDSQNETDLKGFGEDVFEEKPEETFTYKERLKSKKQDPMENENDGGVDEDLRFLENYDFTGNSEEKIDESLFDKNKKKNTIVVEDDLDDIEIPPIKGLNYEEDEQKIEKNDNPVFDDDLEGDEILEKLEMLSHKLK